MIRKTALLSLFLLASALWAVGPSAAAEPAMADYTHFPIYQINAVEPNVLIMMDNSGSMNLQAYYGEYDDNYDYYGYFEPHKRYSYDSNVFFRDPSGPWDGNFLNWLTMRRVDVARKVIMGGLATSRTGGGNQTNIGETPSQDGREFYKTYTDTTDVTPYDSVSSVDYKVDDGYFYVDGNPYTIKVEKDMNTYPDEADNFANGNLAGVIQKVGEKARWGVEYFNKGTGKGESGGTIERTIGTNMTDLITGIENTACDTWTPLAEAYYVAMQYFKQEDPADGLDYPNGCAPNSNLGDDPYYDNEYIYCADSFVILLTDGMSTYDLMIPGDLKDVDGDGNDSGSYDNYGSDYLDDVALYARTTDLRPDLAGDQNLIFYPIYAFGNDPNARTLLQEAAKNGGFVDKDGDDFPSLQSEWDADGDGSPDTYFEAQDGYQLERELVQAINQILERASSGTAVSVLATTGEGEANLVQAYFQPTVPEGLRDVRWTGYLQSLWVDDHGNIREDTDGDYALNTAEDNVITFYLDPRSGDTLIQRYFVSDGNEYPDTSQEPDETLRLDEVEPLWEAGSRLAARSPLNRNIFTYLDQDEDGVVDDNEVVEFSNNNSSSIQPYLGVLDDSTWEELGSTHDARVKNIIDFIRGNEVPGLRTRTRTIDGVEKVWKLGDITSSTPVSVSKPPDSYHMIYKDESYDTYYDAYRDRETVVYVGANDGMLHAFTSWRYDSANNRFVQPDSTSEAIGDELWAYIPQCLLPHLKWLPSTDYTHVDYVDLKPKVFDAKIVDRDGDSEPDWGTILLVGLNMGGKHIWAEGDFDGDSKTETRHFYPSYVCMDVTDPRNPVLLWERSYTDLQMTTSYPAVVKVHDQWFAVFGSGPTDYDGTSTEDGHVYVVDLATGEPYRNGTNDWLFETNEAKAFMNGPVTLDKDLNFNVDAVYFGETYNSGSWQGKVYKMAIPCINADGTYGGADPEYVTNPNDGTNPWRFHSLFNSTQPVTAPLTLSVDDDDNVWVYGGTGRYYATEDKTTVDTQYIFGLKDPFFNTDRTNEYHDYAASAALELQLSDLINTDGYTVTQENCRVYDEADYSSVGNIYNLESDVEFYDGWLRTLETPGERVVTKSSIMGGTLLTPTFVPNNDVCGYGGTSYLYGTYYKTGTAFCDAAFEGGTESVSIDGTTKTKVLDHISLGEGKASQVGAHVGSGGMWGDVRAIVQQSTGEIVTEDVTTAFNIKSGLRSWREK